MVLATLRSKKFKRNLLLLVLILIIPAFVLWGVGSMSDRPVLVGEIGKHKVNAEEFDKSRQGIRIQVLLSYFQDTETLKKIFENRAMVNYMTWERLVYLDAAKKAGVKASDADVRAFIGSHPLFMRNGAFDQAAYTYFLRNNLSMDAHQFEALVKENLQVKNFRQTILKDITVSDEEALDFYKKTNDKVDLSYVFINKDQYADAAKPKDEEVKSFYDENKSKMFSPPRVVAEYIEIPYADAKGRDDAERALTGLYPALEKDPAKFIEDAKAAGLKTGETAPFSREEVIPGIEFSKDFHAAAFSLREGEISPIILTAQDKGTAYLIRKKADVPPHNLSFEEVKGDIEKALADHKAMNITAAKADDILKKISSGETLEQAASDIPSGIKTTGMISYKDYIENVGPAQDAVIAAVETGEGKVMLPIPTDNGMLIARADKITAADVSEFEKNKASITKNILIQKQMAALDGWLSQKALQVKLKKSLEEM
jgi:peptidyl-prolyl cis-trans isomerase D